VHVIKPFVIPSDWNHYVALDYGLDMLAAYKIAVDNNNRAYVLEEVYEGKDNGGTGLIVSEASKRIKTLIAKDKIKSIFAPPDLWNRQKDSGKSIAELYHENGVKLTRVSNDRAAGWLNLKEWLRVYEGEDGRELADIRIFSNCINLIRALADLQVDSQNPNDCMKDPHELTHAPDALRYFVSGRPKKAARIASVPKYNFKSERPKTEGFGLGEKIKPI
jgi:phage terminase large subunit